MKITLDIDPYQLDTILLTALKEYYEYLLKHPFESGYEAEESDDYNVILSSFRVVLQQYMTETEYKQYVDSILH